MLKITPTGATCGATITGINLAKPLTADTITTLRAAWIEHQVIVFPEQELGDADLVRITNYFGAVGDDPYFVPINKHTPVVALTRRADEQAPVFAEVWHTRLWSFKKDASNRAPVYTGLTIPPYGRRHGIQQPISGFGGNAQRIARTARKQGRSALRRGRLRTRWPPTACARKALIEA